MDVKLVMIVKDEADQLGRCLESVRPLIGSFSIVDTGSTDGTIDAIRSHMAGIEGEVHQRPWVSFGANLTEALELAGDDGWLLRMDADMEVTFAHENLLEWLAADPDPDTDAWNVSVVDAGMVYRLPLLLRAGLEWEYKGATHEWLDTDDKLPRTLLGLTITHHADGANRDQKFERDLELLRPGYDAGDPRDTFYFAETLRFLGREKAAVLVYDLRKNMHEGYEEERWYSAYQSAKLRASVKDLVRAWEQRPWRHEPLQAAADIVAQSEHGDALFLSPAKEAF